MKSCCLVKSCQWVFLVSWLPFVPVGLSVQAETAESLTLEQVLTKIDQVGTSLRSMSSSISQKRWTDILQEFDQGESGRFFFSERE